MRERRIGLALAAAALLVVAAEHPSASIRITAHDVGDLSPHRMQVAVDVGLMAVSVLVTWTADRIVQAR